MALFPVTSNPSWGRPPSWIISNGYISATAHSIHLYSAHRVVIFAIAQLSLVLIGLTLDRTVLAWKWIEVIQAIWALMRSLQNSSFTGRSKHVCTGRGCPPPLTKNMGWRTLARSSHKTHRYTQIHNRNLTKR